MTLFTLLFQGPKLLADAYPLACFGLAGLLIAIQLVLSLRSGEPLGKPIFRKPLVFAGLLWAIYGLYEPQMRTAFPTANIRIDLLVLVPLLYTFSVVAAFSLYSQLLGKPVAEAEKPADTPD